MADLRVASPITMISPELPPTLGGLADYIAQVAAEWPTAEKLELVIPKRTGFAAQLPRERGRVLLQYSAYGFDRLGYPRWLLDDLAQWKRATGGRLCVMFHEIWTFWPWWNKNFLVQRLHRQAIARLLREADAVFTTTISQAEHLRSLVPERAVCVLPVGANIMPKTRGDERRERGTAVVFGSQGTRLRALREIADPLRELARSERIKRIISVGAEASETAKRDEESTLDSLQLRGRFEQLGAQPAADISSLLAASEFGIAAQDPLSYTKSTTVMAYAAHGLNILTPSADAAADEPGCLLTSPAELARGLDQGELDRRGRDLRTWYERTASWPQIARAFADALSAQP